jgi:hypothetical protein
MHLSKYLPSTHKLSGTGDTRSEQFPDPCQCSCVTRVVGKPEHAHWCAGRSIHTDHTSGHTHACTHVHTRLSVALVRACAGRAWLLPGSPPASSAHLQECPGPGGARQPGNLSQLLCPVSGKPSTGALPTKNACFAPAPGLPGRPGRPIPPPALAPLRFPEQRVHRAEGYATPFSANLGAPQSQPEDTQAGQLLLG